MRGAGWRGKQNFDRAIADLSEAIRLNMTDPISYHERGIARYFKGEYDLAIKDFTQAIRLDPNHREAFAYRAMSWAKSGDMTRANADLEAVKRLKER
jgi:Flp pilus assembly protein TadD